MTDVINVMPIKRLVVVARKAGPEGIEAESFCFRRRILPSTPRLRVFMLFAPTWFALQKFTSWIRVIDNNLDDTQLKSSVFLFHPSQVPLFLI